MDFKNLAIKPQIRSIGKITQAMENSQESIFSALRGMAPPSIMVNMFGHPNNVRTVVSILQSVNEIPGTSVEGIIAAAELRHKISGHPDVGLVTKIFIATTVMLRELNAGVNKDVAINKAALYIQSYVGKHYGHYEGVKLTLPGDSAVAIFEALDLAIEESKQKQAA